VEAKYKLVELKQRILCNKPTISMFPAFFESMPSSVLNSMQVNDQLRHQKQDEFTDSMIASIIQAEDVIHEYRQLLSEQVSHFSVNNTNSNAGELTKLIQRRFQLIDQQLQSTYTFRVNYFVRSDCGDLEETTDRSPIHYSPSLIIDDRSLHQCTHEQLKLLSRGPTYVSPCQMYLAFNVSSMKEMLEKEYGLLQHHLSILYAKLHVNPAQALFINKEIKEAFMTTFSISLPSSLRQRALYEQQLTQSIRQHLNVHRLILRRTANRRNIFYLGNRKSFQEKANEYMLKSDVFEVTEIIEHNQSHRIQDYLTKVIQSLNAEFETIFNNKKVHEELLKKLHINVATIQLPYLYFLPDVSSIVRFA
jgi:hypothetical protein